MFVKSVQIRRFRSIHHDLTIDLERGVTYLVGENATGKSNIGLAVQRLATRRSGDSFRFELPVEDYPYRQAARSSVRLEIELTEQEVAQLVAGLLPVNLERIPHEALEGAYATIRAWLSRRGNIVHLVGDTQVRSPILTWGDLWFSSETVAVGSQDLGGGIVHGWQQILSNLTAQQLSSDSLESLTNRKHIALDSNPIPGYVERLQSRFKFIEEFTARPTVGQRSAALESVSGTEVASVLFNLKNHVDEEERERYKKIQVTFNQMFPRFTIEAVAQSPESGAPDVQFYENNRRRPMSVSQVSGGICQMLTLIVNLVGRSGLFIFLQHPENHLHPQARRLLHRLVTEASANNQIVVATHDPYFVDPGRPEAIRRTWWQAEKGTEVRGAPKLTGVTRGQLQTVLRSPVNREMLFARTVILVEDESQQLFVRAIAPTLGVDIDAVGVSVIPVGGEKAYRPFFEFLGQLGIPYVALKDKAWGDRKRYPAATHFSLGGELEEFLDSTGLGELRGQLIEAVGDSKPRVAGELGQRLKREEVPSVFHQLLSTASSLAADFPLPLPK